MNRKTVVRGSWSAVRSHWCTAPLKWMIALGLCAALVGCSGTTDIERLRQEMYDQRKYEPLEKSTLFDDGRSERQLIVGTVARGHLRTDELLYTGKVNGQLATTFPFEITPEVLKRGQERFDIYCTPCHGYLGDGRGMVVRRGLKQPPSYHIDRLRQAPPGHFFDVITNGFGVMFSYAERIKPRDRWAIVAYIRALQLSQDATINDVPADIRQRLENE